MPQPDMLERSPGDNETARRSALQLFTRPVSDATFYERWGILLFLLVAWALAAFVEPSFRELSTYQSIMRESAFLGAAAVGMTLAIMSGVFDLSVAANLAFSSVASLLVLERAGPVAAILTALVVASLLGAINGTIVAWLRVPAFVATLGMLFAFRGAALVLTGGEAVRVPNEMFGGVFTSIGSDNWFGIPVPFVLMLVAFGIGWLVLRHSGFGRRLLAVGANERAAAFCGVNVRNVRMVTFVLVGLFAGIASILLTTRVWTADSGTQNGFELMVIAATVLGGTSLAGGRGTLVGTFAAALLFTTIQTYMLVAGVPAFWQRIVTGLVLLIALGIDGVRRRMAGAA